MSKSSLLASVLAVLFASGCATLFQGTNEEIMVASDPAGAQVSINDGRQGTTPYSMRVNRNDDLQIHVSKPGYSSTDIADTSHVEWGYLVSDIFFTGLIGLAVDGIDGAMFYHNQAMVSAHLDPIVPSPAAQSDNAGAPPAPVASAPPISRSAALASDQPKAGPQPAAPIAANLAPIAANPAQLTANPAPITANSAPAVVPAAVIVTPAPAAANPQLDDQWKSSDHDQ
jgi:hypothetical protein